MAGTHAKTITGIKIKLDIFLFFKKGTDKHIRPHSLTFC